MCVQLLCTYVIVSMWFALVSVKNYRWDEDSVNTATVTMEENKKAPLRSNLCMQTGRNACDLTPLSFKFPIYVLKVCVCV